jgi:hypothetical protein
MVDMTKIKRRMINMMRKAKRHFYIHDDVDVLIEEIYGLHLQIAELYVLNDHQDKELERLDREMAELAFDMLCGMQQAPMLLSMRAVKSPRYDRVRQWYDKGFWNKDMVEMAVQAGWITYDEFMEIVNG